MKNLYTMGVIFGLVFFGAQSFVAPSYIYGPQTMFGSRQLYIDPTDYNNNQFVYADVTGIKNLFSDDGTVNKKALEGVSDYFVVVDNATIGSANALVPGSIAIKLSGNTKYIVSLVTGKAYDRIGFAGNYAKSFASNDSASSVEDLDNRISGLIEGQPGNPMRPELVKAIKALVDKQAN